MGEESLAEIVARPEVAPIRSFLEEGQETVAPEKVPSEERSLEGELQRDLSRLVALVANTLEAHSCFLLLPEECFLLLPEECFSPESAGSGLIPISSHTLTPHAIPKRQVVIDSGPLHWVAKTGKSLQVSPFEQKSSVLGVYSADIPLKSFAAIPVRVPARISDGALSAHLPQGGVLAVDSLKAYRFSPLQLKLLRELGIQVERILTLSSPSSLPSQLTFQDEEEKRDLEADALRNRCEEILQRSPKKDLSLLSFSLSSAHAPLPRALLRLFPRRELLHVGTRLTRAWEGAVQALQEALHEEPEQAVYAERGELSLLARNRRLDELSVRFEALLSFRLKRELRYLSEDASEAFFTELFQSLVRHERTPFLELHTSNVLFSHWLCSLRDSFSGALKFSGVLEGSTDPLEDHRLGEEISS
ncbi:GAF domain-containing protein [bacterium]|nr:GAF domain-containing protein [bacterium]